MFSTSFAGRKDTNVQLEENPPRVGNTDKFPTMRVQTFDDRTQHPLELGLNHQYGSSTLIQTPSVDLRLVPPPFSAANLDQFDNHIQQGAPLAVAVRIQRLPRILLYGPACSRTYLIAVSSQASPGQQSPEKPPR